MEPNLLELFSVHLLANTSAMEDDLGSNRHLVYRLIVPRTVGLLTVSKRSVLVEKSSL